MTKKKITKKDEQLVADTVAEVRAENKIPVTVDAVPVVEPEKKLKDVEKVDWFINQNPTALMTFLRKLAGITMVKSVVQVEVDEEGNIKK